MFRQLVAKSADPLPQLMHIEGQARIVIFRTRLVGAGAHTSAQPLRRLADVIG